MDDCGKSADLNKDWMQVTAEIQHLDSHAFSR